MTRLKEANTSKKPIVRVLELTTTNSDHGQYCTPFHTSSRGTRLANLPVINSIVSATDAASDRSSLLPLQQVSNSESRQVRQRTITAAIVFPVSIILTAVASILP